MLATLSRADKQQTLIDIQEALNRRASKHLLAFTIATFPKFDPTWLHKSYYTKLNDFAEGRIKKLAVFMPPQHGKSEGSTRRLPAYLLGRNPNKKIAIVCYNASKARKFNREIQRIIAEPSYENIFFDTKLSNGSDGYARTNDEFEIVGFNGGLRSVGVGGPLTGETVDILIMDDLYKDAQSAWSPVIRESTNDWYDTVAETRLHDESQQLMVFTRWHPEDLAGRLLELQSDWEVVVYPALKEGAPTPEDPREEGEPLYPQKHGKLKLEAIRDRAPLVFGSLYQQNPQPKEGLLYSPFKTYTVLPASKRRVRKSYTDTADEGTDYLCSIVYDETEFGCYVVNDPHAVIYTQDKMENTEPLTAMQLTKLKVDKAKIESNNGGKGFARNVGSQMILLKNPKTQVTWFHQSDNKQVRIFTRQAEVNNLIYMPEGWEKMWPVFYRHVSSYSATGKNAFDDAEDVLSGIAEDFGKNINDNMALLSVLQ